MKQRVLFSGITHSEFTIDYWIWNNGDLYLGWGWEYTPSLNIKLTPFVFYEDEWYEVTNLVFKKGVYDYNRTLDKNVPLIKELQKGKFLEFEIQEKSEPKPEKGSITYEEAISSLETQGIFDPTVPEILEQMGFKVGEEVAWFDDSKGCESNNRAIFMRRNKQDLPKYRECFLDQRFYAISSSKKRAIFTNGHVYVVDTPLYGHALYIFDDYNSALEWAENKINFKEAKEKALLRVVHSKNWKTLVAEALRGW